MANDAVPGVWTVNGMTDEGKGAFTFALTSPAGEPWTAVVDRKHHWIITPDDGSFPSSIDRDRAMGAVALYVIRREMEAHE